MKLKIELVEEECEFNDCGCCDFIGRRCQILDIKSCCYYKEKYIKNTLSIEEVKKIIKKNQDKTKIIEELLDEANFKRG